MVTGTALVTTNIIAARAAPNAQKGTAWQEHAKKEALIATRLLRAR